MSEPNPASQHVDETTDNRINHDDDTVTLNTSEQGVERVTNSISNHKEVEHGSGLTSEQDSDHAEPHGDAAKTPPDPEKTRSKGKTALIMAALMMAVFLAALDMTIVTTALPTIAADFNISNADYTWVGSAYLLAAAASTPTWGKISDTFGRKPTILVANVIFLVGSLICALSINVQMLLGGRVIQGIGGGGLIILANICITDLFSMRSRGLYYGLIGMVWAFASAVGPVLGGVFTEYVTWRWCFYINLPCDGAAFILLFLFLEIHNPRTPILAGLKAIDWLGTIAIVGGTVMFLMGLEYGGVAHPWNSPIVVCLIVFGIVAIAIFFILEPYVPKYPLMPLHIFASTNNIACFSVGIFHGMTFISGSYFLPLYFQAVLGATPLLSGVYTFPYVISQSLISASVGIFIRKTGRYREPIWAGTCFMTLGFGLYINFPAYASWPRIIIYQIIAGVGTGPLFQAPLIALQSKLKPRDIAAATATFGFLRNLGTSVAVVIGGVIFQNEMKKHDAVFAGLQQGVRQQLENGSAGASTAIVQSLSPAQKEPVLEAYAQSLSIMWIFFTCTAFAAALSSAFIHKRTLSKTHEDVKTGLAGQEEGRLERQEEKRKSRKSKDGLHPDVEKARDESS